MTIPTIETPHLILRLWRLEDANPLFSILQEPYILDYFPPTSFTVEKTSRYINHQLDHWRDHGYGHWAVILKADNSLIG
jgi:RimJ/RimL family protein N-acetyltransferase